MVRCSLAIFNLNNSALRMFVLFGGVKASRNTPSLTEVFLALEQRSCILINKYLQNLFIYTSDGARGFVVFVRILYVRETEDIQKRVSGRIKQL